MQQFKNIKLIHMLSSELVQDRLHHWLSSLLHERCAMNSVIQSAQFTRYLATLTVTFNSYSWVHLGHCSLKT